LQTVNVATDEELQALKRAGFVQQNARVLGRQQAGFGGQQVGSRPSSALGCRRAEAEMNEELRRFLLVGKAHVGSVLAGQVDWLLAGRQTLYK
jgi:hypothetical protein